jgi:hypothetical protein
MSSHKLLIGLSALFLVSAAALGGCAVDAADAEAVEESGESELSAAGKALIGSYVDDTGAFKGLVLTHVKHGQRNEFWADVDTGVRCITTPCPSSERIEGTFTAGTKTITLRSTSASSFAQHLLGQYRYTKQGDKLTLFRKDFSQSLAASVSYCAEASDCWSQDLIHPMCLGGWTCSPQNTCGWKCGSFPVDPDPVDPPAGAVCLSSSSCAAGEYCTTEDGVCNPYGMLAVCAGTCALAPQASQ